MMSDDTSSETTMIPTQANILSFWDEQAEKYGEDPRANTPDRWIHHVELAAVARILRTLSSPSDILDIGCANGYSTFLIHKAFPDHRITGIDLSEKMIGIAQKRLLREGLVESSNLRFRVMDMLEMEDFAEAFDVAITIRGLINLPGTDSQWKAIAQIAGCLRPGGRYIAVENFRHAQENLNSLRRNIGLPALPYRWHNCWLDENDFRKHCSEFFDLLEFLPITSTYYLITRVVYSRLCQLEARDPDYDHPIYEIATKIPPLGDFGPVKLSYWKKR